MNKRETTRKALVNRINSLRQVSYDLSVSTFKILAITEDSLGIDERTFRKHLNKCLEIVEEAINVYKQQLADTFLNEDYEELDIETEEKEEVE